MRSNPIKTVQNQERSLRTTNNNRNTELTGNKNPLNTNGESVYGHSISGFVATQTPLAVASTVGNEFAGYEFNYDNSVDNSKNNIFEFTNLTKQVSYPEKFEITAFSVFQKPQKFIAHSKEEKDEIVRDLKDQQYKVEVEELKD